MANILLIDDDPVLLKMYSTRLAHDQHQVQTALNGEAALQALTPQAPDLIVLDLLMPKMNGFQFLEKLKQNPQTANIPLIVFSSVANQEQIERLRQLGVTDYLNKSDTTPSQLVAHINQKLNISSPGAGGATAHDQSTDPSENPA